MTWHRHIWRVTTIEPSFLERLPAGTSIGSAPADIALKVVTYTCEKCGTQKVERA